MGLLQYLKTNNSTFHIRTKEEIDQLFRELAELKKPIDNKLDFYIRMSMQKVKLQLYYEMKLFEYRRTVNSATKDTHSEEKAEPAVKEKKAIITKKKKAKTSLQKEDELRIKKTKEELIAENKARIAKYHPEPDFSSTNPKIAKERQKIKHEKEMMERTKNKWLSIVSIPMGGLNK